MNELLVTVQRSTRLPFHHGRGGWIITAIVVAAIIALFAFMRNRSHDEDRGGTRNEFRNDHVHRNNLRTEFAEDDQITEKELQNHLRDQENRDHNDHF